MARPRQITDEQILSTARSCFLEHGPGVSTAVIAERLGVSPPALFKRFHSKAELMLAALLPPADPTELAAVEAGPDARPIPVQLRELAGLYLQLLRNTVPCIMALQASGMDPDHILSRYAEPPPVKARDALIGWLERAQAQGRAAPRDTGAVAGTILGALHHRVFFNRLLGDRAPDMPDALYVEKLIEALWSGIAPEENP
jgi:AcrR family transcriptional regulator